MTKKFTLNTAVNFQGMEQRTAHLQDSLSLNLFNKLKWISFVIIMGLNQMLLSQTIFNQPIQLPGTPLGPSLPEVLTVDPAGNVFRSPYFPLQPAGSDSPSLFWNPTTGSWNSNSNLKILPPLSAIFPSSLSETFYFRGTAPSDNVPLLVEGNVGTNHGTLGTFGQAVGNARWNALGDRIPFSTTPNPYIRVTGFRSTWNEFGVNVGMADRYTSGSIKDALISWQDATVSGPTNANNRLVFGVRDGSTTIFQELGQLTSNGSFGIGLANTLIPLTEKLELYDFGGSSLYQRWRTDPISAGSRIGLNGTNDNFEIRNEENANIEFWTNNNPQVYINEQPGGTPFLGVGTAGPINIPALSGSITTFTPNSGPSVIIPMLSVSGSGTFNGSLGVIGDVYSLSDERLKENFNSLEYDWKKILNVNSYSYQFKKTEGINLSEGMKYGFKAQEVNEIIPELTSVFANGLSINYQGFIPFITQGLKEHEDRIAVIEEVKETEKHILEQVKLLENENNELKNQNELLKERLEALERKFESICQLPCLQEGSVKSKNTRINGGTLELMDNAILYQNEPNPFTSSTVIRYYLPEGTKNSKITVKNTDGKVVGEFQKLISGNGSITIEPGKLAANTYYYSLIIDGIEVETKKMILMR
jgi:hypothetical protein